jgi:hypothetical protein
MLALILVLARASQRWVEDPVRLSHISWSRTLSLYGIAPAVLIVTLALLAARGDRWGLPVYPESERKALAEFETHTRPAHLVEWVCQQHVLDPSSLTDPKCEFGSGDGPARILLLGDSQAAQFAALFRIAAEAQGLRMRSVALGACAPLEGSLQGVVAGSRVEACEQGMPQMLERARDFPLLIIGAAWAGYARNDPGVWARLESQLHKLTAQGHRVWLLPKVPEFADYDTACPAKRVRVGEWLRCPAALVQRDTGGDTNARLAAIARRVPGVRFLPLHEALCAGAPCPVADPQGHYLYADPSHLSMHGSRHLAGELIRTNLMPAFPE